MGKNTELSFVETDLVRDINECVGESDCKSESRKLTQFERVRQWAGQRGLYEKGDSKTQFVKLIEEVGETGKAILKDDQPEIMDGLGDAFVVLVNLAYLCGYNLEDCIEEALTVIESRSGKMVNGTFIKSEDL